MRAAQLSFIEVLKHIYGRRIRAVEQDRRDAQRKTILTGNTEHGEELDECDCALEGIEQFVNESLAIPHEDTHNVARGLATASGVPPGLSSVLRALRELDKDGGALAKLRAFLRDFPTFASHFGISEPKQRGPKPDTNRSCDKHWFEKWDSGKYKTYADLAKELSTQDHPVSRSDVRRAIERHHKRCSRGSDKTVK